MKPLLTLLLTLCLTAVQAQSQNSQTLLDSAKTLFKSRDTLYGEAYENFDYHKVASMLEEVVAADPTNVEARYFLANTCGRINSYDGEGMFKANLNLTLKISEQLEKVIELTPKYTGEIIYLDPYSKLQSEWSVMAMTYLHQNKRDSAVWAFKEGKRRGGFGDFTLAVYRKTLDACSKNAILISSGDNCTFPLWYLQTVENYRTDVAVMDVTLLSAAWYPVFLMDNKIVAFDLSRKKLNRLDWWVEWKGNPVTVGKFSWTPTLCCDDDYLSRGEYVFLSMLRANKFKRDVFFTVGFPEESRLGLKPYLSSRILVDKLCISKKEEMSFEEYKTKIVEHLKLSELINKNSTDELQIFDYYIRLHLLNETARLLNNNETEKATELMKLMYDFADEQKVPFQRESIKEYVDKIEQNL